jgi:hypothetical protein
MCDAVQAHIKQVVTLATAPWPIRSLPLAAMLVPSLGRTGSKGQLHLAETVASIAVGSEEARLCAGLRPPLKLHVQFPACSFREDSATPG